MRDLRRRYGPVASKTSVRTPAILVREPRVEGAKSRLRWGGGTARFRRRTGIRWRMAVLVCTVAAFAVLFSVVYRLLPWLFLSSW